MPGLSFLSKKKWHPARFDNQKRVFIKEQAVKTKQESNDAASNEVRKEQDIRFMEQMCEIQQSDPRSTELKFMYCQPVSEKQKEGASAGASSSNSNSNSNSSSTGSVVDDPLTQQFKQKLLDLVAPSSSANASDSTSGASAPHDAAHRSRQEHDPDQGVEHGPKRRKHHHHSRRAHAETDGDGNETPLAPTPVPSSASVLASVIAASAASSGAAGRERGKGQGQGQQAVGGRSEDDYDSHRRPPPLAPRSELERDVGRLQRPHMTAAAAEERFPQLRNAPTEGSYTAGIDVHHKPFNGVIRYVMCKRCGVWGHASGDRECVLRDVIPSSDFARQKREDPMYAYSGSGSGGGASSSGGSGRECSSVPLPAPAASATVAPAGAGRGRVGVNGTNALSAAGMLGVGSAVVSMKASQRQERSQQSRRVRVHYVAPQPAGDGGVSGGGGDGGGDGDGDGDGAGGGGDVGLYYDLVESDGETDAQEALLRELKDALETGAAAKVAVGGGRGKVRGSDGRLEARGSGERGETVSAAGQATDEGQDPELMALLAGLSRRERGLLMEKLKELYETYPGIVGGVVDDLASLDEGAGRHGTGKDSKRDGRGSRGRTHRESDRKHAARSSSTSSSSSSSARRRRSAKEDRRSKRRKR